MRHVVFPLLLILAACAEFPDFDQSSRNTDDAQYPSFLSPNQYQIRTDERSAPTAELTDRLARLQARGAQLRRPVLSIADRARINRGISS